MCLSQVIPLTTQTSRPKLHTVSHRPDLKEIAPFGHVPTAERGSREDFICTLLYLDLNEHHVISAQSPLAETSHSSPQYQVMCSSLCPEMPNTNMQEHVHITTVYIKVLCFKKNEANRKN
jgi:hypothetical protein